MKSSMVRIVAIAILFSGGLASYGSSGFLEPTIKIGAPSIVEMEKLTPERGIASVPNERFAAENACRSDWMSSPTASGMSIPNTRAPDGFTAPDATCQWALARICDSWIARNSASGSLSVYRRFTEPGFADSAFSSSAAFSGDMVRQAIASFIRSVSNRAAAASFSNPAALTNAFPAVLPASTPSFFASSIFTPASVLYRSSSRLDSASSIRCNLTTAHVAAPASNAKNPATIRNTTIAFSQPPSEKPSTRLTLFEKIAVGVIATLLLAFVALGVFVIWDFCRGNSRC